MKFFLPILAGLCLATAAFGQDSGPKPTTETIGNWQKVCIENEGKQRCEIKQTLATENKQRIAVLTVVRNENKALIMRMALPHLLNLQVPVELSVGEQAVRLPYLYCNKVACFAMFELKDAMLTAFRKGLTGNIKVSTLDRKSVGLTFSLKGFTKASNSLPVLK